MSNNAVVPEAGRLPGLNLGLIELDTVMPTNRHYCGIS